MDDISDIRAWYDRGGEEQRLAEHQLEHDITWRYLKDYLPPQGGLLELGAGGGAYTLDLARRGYALTTLDLSVTLTEVLRQRAVKAHLEERIRCLVGDARDLSALVGESYDAVLVMGPLYHLVHEAERRLVLRQVQALLRPGGVVVSAFICRWGMLGEMLRDQPAWLQETEEVRSVLERGRDPEGYFHSHPGFRGYFARPDELAPLHEAEGFTTLVVAAVEPTVGADDASYNNLTGPLRQAWLDVLYGVSAEPSMLGASRHLLYIGRKPTKE